jgi:DNA polymerase I
MNIFDRITTLDFETEAIDGAKPPKPVGLAVRKPDGKAYYMAWGHEADNNCVWEDARQVLIEASRGPCLFHNAAFDIGVMLEHMKLPIPQQIHDTMLLLFLYNPHAKTLALKESAQALLKLPPAEQDLLKEWVLLNVPGAKPSTWGACISKAPARFVRPYAIGDVDRTFELFKTLYDKHRGPAYDRELKLLPILLNSTLEGVRIDLKKLIKDYRFYVDVHGGVAKRIYDKVGMSFNISSADELADAISKSNIDAKWVYTATGKRSVAKKNLMSAIQDRELIALLSYHSTLSTYLESFFTSWLNKCDDDILRFSWNQVRNSERGGTMGTRTGRLSSTPSMLNVPKDPPTFDTTLDLPPLPFMRQYLLPDEGMSWLKRDYSSQELRLLAHYEDGQMMQAYRADPLLDLHQFASDVLTQVLGKPVSRRAAKTIAFSLLYGQGLDALAASLDCTYEEAKTSKAAYLREFSGVKSVEASIKSQWNKGLPIKTWGGREYYKEPSKLIKDKKTGKERYADFGYKGLNYLIQGSSADVTKQALINYNSIKQDGRFLISVHDEINISGPAKEMKLLNEAMLDINVDVPMISEGSYGLNYGNLTKEQL